MQNAAFGLQCRILHWALQRAFPVIGILPLRLQRAFPVMGILHLCLQREFPVMGILHWGLQSAFPVIGILHLGKCRMQNSRRAREYFLILTRLPGGSWLARVLRGRLRLGGCKIKITPEKRFYYFPAPGICVRAPHARWTRPPSLDAGGRPQGRQVTETPDGGFPFPGPPDIDLQLLCCGDVDPRRSEVARGAWWAEFVRSGRRRGK